MSQWHQQRSKNKEQAKTYAVCTRKAASAAQMKFWTCPGWAPVSARLNVHATASWRQATSHFELLSGLPSLAYTCSEEQQQACDS